MIHFANNSLSYDFKTKNLILKQREFERFNKKDILLLLAVSIPLSIPLSILAAISLPIFAVDHLKLKWECRQLQRVVDGKVKTNNFLKKHLKKIEQSEYQSWLSAIDLMDSLYPKTKEMGLDIPKKSFFSSEPKSRLKDYRNEKFDCGNFLNKDFISIIDQNPKLQSVKSKVCELEKSRIKIYSAIKSKEKINNANENQKSQLEKEVAQASLVRKKIEIEKSHLFLHDMAIFMLPGTFFWDAIYQNKMMAHHDKPQQLNNRKIIAMNELIRQHNLDVSNHLIIPCI